MPQLHGNGQAELCVADNHQPDGRFIGGDIPDSVDQPQKDADRADGSRPAFLRGSAGALEAIPEYAAENAQFSGQSAGNLVDRIFRHDGYPDAAFRHPGFPQRKPAGRTESE